MKAQAFSKVVFDDKYPLRHSGRTRYGYLYDDVEPTDDKARVVVNQRVLVIDIKESNLRLRKRQY